MKVERLDQILLRLGYVDEEQIKQALMRQKARGGRLGSHLLYFKSITEEQLTHALSEQYKVPSFNGNEHKVSKALLNRLPVEIAEQYLVLPLELDSESETLSLAMVNPEQPEALSRVKRAMRVRKIHPYVGPESLIRKLITEHYRGGNKDTQTSKIIELPDLFREGSPVAKDDQITAEEGLEPPRETQNVLLISRAVSLRNFLAPILEREGWKLRVECEPEEIARALDETPFDRLLIAQDMVEEFSKLVKQGKIPRPQTEVAAFSSVSAALLDNPAPYKRVMGSLFRALQAIADQRCADLAWTPPFDRICRDIRELTSVLGFRRLASDGLQVAACLLIPQVDDEGVAPSGGAVPTRLGFGDLDRTMELAKSIRFPWNVEAALQAFLELLSGLGRAVVLTASNKEISVAAQVLAVVLYRYCALRHIEGPPEKVVRSIKSGLRKQAGKLASLEIVEAYTRLLDQDNEVIHSGHYNQIFVVSQPNEASNQFAAHLKRAGFRTVKITDLKEARRLCERQPPAVVLISYESFPDEILECGRAFKRDPGTLLYAFVSASKPSIVLDLLDGGFDDVFVPPINYDIIVARISKSLKTLAQQDGASDTSQGFSAALEAFSLIDLIQALGQSQRSVHISLVRGNGEKADMHMREGKLVHAACGKLTGADAVYRVITWEADGVFNVEPVTAFPLDNVSETIEALLMEGCRLLDESRR